jgi:hypothetical protein
VIVAAIMPLGLVGLQLILPRLEFAPLFILIAAAFVPLSLPTGTESRVVDSLLLTMLFVGIWAIRMLTVEKRLWLKPSPINKPLLGFAFIILFSVIWSMAFRDPLVTIWKSFPFVQIGSAITMVMLPGAFLLVANYINSVRLLQVMVVLTLVAGAIAVIRRLGFLSILVINDGGLFTMWVVGLSFGLALFHRKLAWPWRGLLFVLAGGWIYVRFGQQITWLAGWLPAFVALGVLSFMRSKKLLLVFLVIGVIFIGLNADYYLGSVIEAESEASGHTRLAAWITNWQVTGKHLLLGTGPAGYAAYYMSYFPDNAMATHSNYIDILAQTGLIGLGLCIWFFFALAWQGYKLCLRLRGQGDFSEGLANAALAGTVSCIVSMAFGDWLFPFAYTQTITGFDYVVYSWLFMGTIPVLDRFLAQTRPGVKEDTLLTRTGKRTQDESFMFG